MSTTLTAIITSLKYLTHRRDDDFIDRLHYFTTTNLLISLSVLVSFKQFGGRPVECMLPDYFPHSWEQYAENYCWAQDTYFLSFDIDLTRRTPRDYKISYYQWVPFFLLIEAACFRLPSLVWKYFAAHSGIRIHDIVSLAVDERNIQTDIKQNNIHSLTVHLQNALRFHRRLLRKRITPHKILRFLNLPYSAVFVTFTYMLTKLLYLFNVWAQLLMLNRFLNTDTHSWYGWGVLQDLLGGTTWKTSGVFPRVTLCDFEVRGMGNLQNHTVQCVLVINIFNERIFIFLWFWYMGLMILTTASFLYWLYVILLPWPARSFITRHLELSEMPFDPRGSAKDVERFVSGYLKTDGVFVLRMITMHSGIIFGTELVLSLWRSFYGIEEEVRRGGGGGGGSDDPGYLTPTPTAGDDAFQLKKRRPPSSSTGRKISNGNELFEKPEKTKTRNLKKSRGKQNGDDDDDDDILLKELKKPKNEPDEDEDHFGGNSNTGITEVLLKGPRTRSSSYQRPSNVSATRRLRPTAALTLAVNTLEMPDSGRPMAGGTTSTGASRGARPSAGEVKIDFDDYEEDEDEIGDGDSDSDNDSGDAILKQRRPPPPPPPQRQQQTAGGSGRRRRGAPQNTRSDDDREVRSGAGVKDTATELDKYFSTRIP